MFDVSVNITPLNISPLGWENSVAWTVPVFARNQVNAAAKLVVANVNKMEFTAEEFDAYQEAYEVVHNWRSAHAYPLNTFQMNLRNTASRFDDTPLIAQRMKRLASIIHKLERFPDMRLTQMQGA